MCLIGIILVWFDRKCKYYCLLFPKKLLTLLNINRDWLILAWLWETYFKIHWSKFEKKTTVLYKKRYSRRFSLNVFLSSPFQLYKTHFIFQSFAFNNRNISKLSIYRVIFPTQEACNAVQYFKILKKCNLWDILGTFFHSLHNAFFVEVEKTTFSMIAM